MLNVKFRTYYMSTHVSLNLLNKLRKTIKCKACQAFYYLFFNKFNKFNITGAQMLDSVYHEIVLNKYDLGSKSYWGFANLNLA